MGDLLTGLVKGLSGFMPQDDPDVKIFNAQTEVKELAEKMEKVYARLGKQVYEANGGEGFPEVKAELDLLSANRRVAEERVREAKEEKAARERARQEEEARLAEQTANGGCPNCSAVNPPGTNFCQECGTRLTSPETTAPAKRFCPNCGTEILAGQRFCCGCGTKMEGI